MHFQIFSLSKVANGISPVKKNEIFHFRKELRYNLCHTSKLVIPPIHSVYHGGESASYFFKNLGINFTCDLANRVF